MTNASTSSVTLPDGYFERALAAGVDVVVLPRQVGDDGNAIYSEASVSLVKELRDEGLDAAYLDAAEARLFEVKKGDLADATQWVAIWVASSGAWDGIKAVLRRVFAGTSRLEVTYAEVKPDGSRRAFDARGQSDDVIDAIDRMLSSDDEAPPEQEDDEGTSGEL